MLISNAMQGHASIYKQAKFVHKYISDYFKSHNTSKIYMYMYNQKGCNVI